MWKHGLSLLMLTTMLACGQAPQATTDGGTAEAPGGAAVSTATIHETPVAQAAVSTHGGPVHDHVSLIDHLRAQGFTVELAGNVEQPFLQAKGTVIHLSGGPITQPADVQSYDYNDTDLGGDGAAAAAADAQQLDQDGNPRTTMITWVAPPHFFRKERAFVLYLGDDPAVLQALTDALGPQFAGR